MILLNLEILEHRVTVLFVQIPIVRGYGIVASSNHLFMRKPSGISNLTILHLRATVTAPVFW